MNQIQIVRVTELPNLEDRSPSTIYIVSDTVNGMASMFFTGNTADTILRGITKQDVETLIAQSVGGFADIKFVQNISERDAIVWSQSGMVLVLDATDDLTVEQGAAAYLYQLDSQTFTKIYEFESLDIVQNWENIQGRPVSSPESIDDAVNKAHSHSDLETLELYGRDIDGPKFNGQILVTANLSGSTAW